MQSQKKPIISVVLPVYNEAETIAKVIEELDRILSKSPFEIIIVDDSSSDGTSLVVSEVAKKLGNIELVVKGKKRGKGIAVIEGLKRARGSVIAVMDADGSYDPRMIPYLASMIIEGEADLVIGSRFVKGARVSMPIMHRIVSLFFDALARLSFQGLYSTDIFSGFRVYNRNVLKPLSEIRPYRYYYFEVESLVLIKRKGFKVVELPVIERPRYSLGYGRSKAIMPVSAFVSLIKDLIMLIIRTRRFRAKRT